VTGSTLYLCTSFGTIYRISQKSSSEPAGGCSATSL
jgi:hypothetical protein